MEKFYRNVLACFIVLVVFFLLALLLNSCGTVSKLKTTTHTDSTGLRKSDSSYSRRDSAGNTYTREIYREYYHDTTRTILQPYSVLTKEIIYERGQSSVVKTDTGHVARTDTASKVINIDLSDKERSGIGFYTWIFLLAIAILFAVIIFLIKRK